MNWLRRVFRSAPREVGSTRAEIEEAVELRKENRRHVHFIEQHVAEVSARVRAEAIEGEERLRR